MSFLENLVDDASGTADARPAISPACLFGFNTIRAFY
jgi:hypothetical protein